MTHRDFLRSIAFSFCLAAAACGPAEVAETADQNVETASALAFDKILPELAAKGITGSVRKLVDKRLTEASGPDGIIGAPEPENAYYLAVEFGAISREHFDTIRTFFGGRSQVPFDAERKYDLVDFLDPSMQAVVNKLFTTESFSGSQLSFTDDEIMSDNGRTFALTKGGLEINTNCFETSIEFIREQQADRRDDRLLFYIPGRDETTKWFTDDRFSDAISDEGLHFGDVLLVRQQSAEFNEALFIAHTAVVLSKQLVIEKTNAADHEPFRISLRRDVLALYERTLGDTRDISYRRFGTAGKTAPPAPSLPANALSPHQAQAIARAFPGVRTENVILTEEFRFGGGFDLNAGEIQSAEVAIDPKTGRGVLKGDDRVLGRFRPLVAK